MTKIRKRAEALVAELSTEALALPLRPGKKFPDWPRWQSAAPPDERWSDASAYGIRLEGLTVVDFDGSGWEEHKEQLKRWFGYAVRTGRGGLHCYARGESPAGSSSLDWVDIVKSGRGHQVVGEGSVVDHSPYVREWGSPSDIRPIKAKRLERLRGSKDMLAELDDEGPIPAGHRNNALASIAGRLRRMGLTTPALYVQLLEINHQQCRPPLSKSEVRAIAESIGKREGSSLVEQTRHLLDDTEAWPMVDVSAEVGDVEGSPLMETPCGNGVFIKGKTNWLSSDPGVGKSWILLLAAREAALAGMHVLWIDGDDVVSTMIVRTQTLEGAASALMGRLYRVDSSAACDGKSVRRLLEQHPMGREDDFSDVLVIIDTATSAGAPRDGQNVNEWLGWMVRPFFQRNATVIVADHLSKNVDSRRFGAVGSGQKIADVSGCALRLEPMQGGGFTRGGDGSLKLIVVKDRTGLTRTQTDRAVATVRGTTLEDGRLRMELADPPDDAESDLGMDDAVGSPADAADLREERILELLRSTEEPALTAGEIMRSVPGHEKAKRAALEALEARGEIRSAKSGRKRLWMLDEEAHGE